MLPDERIWLAEAATGARRIPAIEAALAASAQREQDALSAIGSLAAAVAAGGGSVDAAAIIARIDERTADVTGRIAALEAELDEAREAHRKAAQAAAIVFDDDPTNDPEV